MCPFSLSVLWLGFFLPKSIHLLTKISYSMTMKTSRKEMYTWYCILQKCCPMKLSVMIEIFYVLSANIVAISHMWLLVLTMWLVWLGNLILKLFKFNLNLYSHIWLVTTMLDSTILEFKKIISCIFSCFRTNLHILFPVYKCSG